MGEPHPADSPDGNEITDPLTPHIRAVDALHPQDIGISETVKGGFTTVFTGPGSGNIIGGTGCALKLRAGRIIDDIVLPGTTHMKMALGENPKRCYGSDKKAPMTRMGTAALLREILFKARNYGEAKKLHAEDSTKPDPAWDFKLESLQPVIRGEMKVRIHCHRVDDIYTAIRISEEFGLDFAIEHCTEGYMIADILAARKIPCVIGPLNMGLEKLEIWYKKLECPQILSDAGVEICMTQDGCSETSWLPVYIGMCIARGFRQEKAFEAVTVNPARLLGLSDRVGSLDAGKDADIAVWNGNPFLNTTLCKGTMIDGKWEHRAF